MCSSPLPGGLFSTSAKTQKQESKSRNKGKSIMVGKERTRALFCVGVSLPLIYG
jgi:hypothetical protein